MRNDDTPETASDSGEPSRPLTARIAYAGILVVDGRQTFDVKVFSDARWTASCDCAARAAQPDPPVGSCLHVGVARRHIADACAAARSTDALADVGNGVDAGGRLASCRARIALDPVGKGAVERALDTLCPGWSVVSDCFDLGDSVAVVVSLTVGNLTRDGLDAADRLDPDALAHAERRAFEAAARRFGLEVVARGAGPLGASTYTPGPSPACGPLELSDRATPLVEAQSSDALELGRRLRVDADERSRQMFGQPLGALSAEQAAALVAALEREEEARADA